jgi:hypothetical protein
MWKGCVGVLGELRMLMDRPEEAGERLLFQKYVGKGKLLEESDERLWKSEAAKLSMDLLGARAERSSKYGGVHQNYSNYAESRKKLADISSLGVPQCSQVRSRQ